MAKLTEVQQRSLDRLKKALANHKEKPTKETAEVALKQYEGALRNTLHPDHLSKEEVATLKALTDSPE